MHRASTVTVLAIVRAVEHFAFEDVEFALAAVVDRDAKRGAEIDEVDAGRKDGECEGAARDIGGDFAFAEDADHFVAIDKIARAFEHHFGPAFEGDLGHAGGECDAAAVGERGAILILLGAGLPLGGGELGERCGDVFICSCFYSSRRLLGRFWNPNAARVQ